MTPSARDVATRGLWQDNPALVQLLGLCPLLAVSNTVVNSLGLGIATFLVLIMSNLVISSIRRFLDENTRLPAQIMVIATFVTCADILLQAWFFDLHHRIGLFVALIVTNCALLGRAESFARRNTLPWAILDGAMMGLGFLIAIVAMGAIREVLGHGTLFANMNLLFGPTAANWTLTLSDNGFLLTILPPGAFLTLGCLIALKNLIDNIAGKRSRSRLETNPQN
ncbi:MAG: electron transport complex subunit E [Pseudomonadales bacterium]